MELELKQPSEPDHDGSLQIGDLAIPVQVRRGGKRAMRLSFEAGQLIVTHPRGQLDTEAEAFLADKRRWIVRHFSKQRKASQQRSEFLSNIRSETQLLGLPRAVQLKPARLRKYRVSDDVLVLYAPADQLDDPKPLLKTALRNLAKVYLQKRLDYWAERTDLAYNVLRIKDASTRWGSASTKLNINLNWHLILLDKAVIDYVIVHELMHLIEMNHSPRFWALVEAHYPDYRRQRDRLNENQWLLGIYD